MNNHLLDHWASWIAERRYGGNLEYFQMLQSGLRMFSDRIIASAGLMPGARVLDVGTGDGVVGIRALTEVGDEGSVIFTDVSADVVALAKEALAGAPNCEFVVTGGETLDGIPDESVDAVVWRAVLMYSADRPSFFQSAYRVLKPGGTISFSETINQFSVELSPENLFYGFDFSPIPEIMKKLRPAFKSPGPKMANYSERDVFRMVMDAGFMNIKMETESSYMYRGMHPSWDAFISTSPNPNAPTLREAAEQTLTEAERETFYAYLKPLVETTPALRLFSQTFINAKKQ